MICPICKREVWVGVSYDPDGNEHGTVTHICQVIADSKGAALAEYQSRVDELYRKCAECINDDDEYAYDSCSDCFYRDTYFGEDSWDD